MKITDLTKAPASKETTLNAIPIGTFFRGEVWGRVRKEWVPGVFYKAAGPTNYNGQTFAEVVVVPVPPVTEGRWNNTFHYCTTVRNYEPLDVELIIKGVL